MGIRTLDQASEEALASEVGIWKGQQRDDHVEDQDGQWASRCSLEGVTSLMATSLKLFGLSMRLRCGGECSLPTALEAGDDGTNQATLVTVSSRSDALETDDGAYLDAIRLDSNEAGKV